MRWIGSTPAERPPLDTKTFEDDVAILLERLRAIGIASVVVVDLSREEVGIPVVKVIVPGLEGHSHGASYRPGARAQARAKRPA